MFQKVKMDKFRLVKEMGKNRFANRVVDECRKLSSHVENANTRQTFKKA